MSESTPLRDRRSVAAAPPGEIDRQARIAEAIDRLAPAPLPTWGAGLDLEDELAIYAAEAQASDSLLRSRARRRRRSAWVRARDWAIPAIFATGFAGALIAAVERAS
jgi:hypothetical protein